jgi:MoaA/NifB/PqqE/SkfB family radical SAM enzyme
MAIERMGQTGSATKRTRSGVFTRLDSDFGLIAYSPYTGLSYAIHPTDVVLATKWLDSTKPPAPSVTYRDSLGIGWDLSTDGVKHLDSHLLPNRESWSTLPTPTRPILINWFLTGRCPLACTYCYAEDLMRNDESEPDIDQIERIADTILTMDPLVVVLTGGDPLFSPHLRRAIQLLSRKVGIVVDTSGYTFSASHLELFKQYNIAVRVSLDSERPQINQAQRPVYPGYPKLVRSGPPTGVAAVNALVQLLEAEITVTVQTVATKKNINELLSLGDKLFRLGVQSWRVFQVADSAKRHEGYLKLVGTHTDKGKKKSSKRGNGPYEFVFRKLLLARKTHWKESMSIQVTQNDKPNAVILVGPDGTFYTESNVRLGKTVLDESNPTRPSLHSIKTKVNMLAHAERYFNLTRP